MTKEGFVSFMTAACARQPVSFVAEIRKLAEEIYDPTLADEEQIRRAVAVSYGRASALACTGDILMGELKKAVPTIWRDRE